LRYSNFDGNHLSKVITKAIFNRNFYLLLPPIFDVQKEGVKIVKKMNPKNKLLEDYLSIFQTLDFSKEKYRETIELMLTIASNNGFRYMED